MSKNLIAELVIKNLKNKSFQNEKGFHNVNGFVLYHPTLGYMSLGYKDANNIELPFVINGGRNGAKAMLTDGSLENCKNIVFVQEGQYKF